jgi:transcriptional regulator with PAS, ATPase and Fis domain
VLQERTVRPVGSTSEEPVDVRILASTNRDPAGALRSGQLRPDLYYRLCVTSVTMPSLRKRRDDIPALVEYHLAGLNRRVSDPAMQVRGVAPEAMRLLAAQEWPGNVRELFNVIENAFTMGTPLIRPETLELAGGEPEAEPPDDGPRLATFEAHERSLIERMLAQTGGNKLRAARELGISRKKLYARMARYGLLALVAGMVAVS